MTQPIDFEASKFEDPELAYWALCMMLDLTKHDMTECLRICATQGEPARQVIRTEGLKRAKRVLDQYRTGKHGKQKRGRK